MGSAASRNNHSRLGEGIKGMSKTDLDKYFYPRKPRKVRSGGWFYEQRDGLVVLHVAGMSEVKIPWSQVEKALKDHNEARRK